MERCDVLIECMNTTGKVCVCIHYQLWLIYAAADTKCHEPACELWKLDACSAVLFKDMTGACKQLDEALNTFCGTLLGQGCLRKSFEQPGLPVYSSSLQPFHQIAQSLACIPATIGPAVLSTLPGLQECQVSDTRAALSGQATVLCYGCLATERC